MHWIIDLILIAGMAYLAYQVETARAEIASLALWADSRQRQHRETLDGIQFDLDAITKQLNTPGTRHWTRPEEPDYNPYAS